MSADLLSAAKEALALIRKGVPGWGVAKDILNAAIAREEAARRRISQPSAERAELISWLLERRDNCQRIAAGRSGDVGWLEDARYFNAAVNAVANASAEGATATPTNPASDGRDSARPDEQK